MSSPDTKSDSDASPTAPLRLVKTRELQPDGQLGSCLRPLGLCELGGCCDVCWYGGGRQSSTERDRPPTSPE